MDLNKNEIYWFIKLESSGTEPISSIAWSGVQMMSSRLDFLGLHFSILCVNPIFYPHMEFFGHTRSIRKQSTSQQWNTESFYPETVYLLLKQLCRLCNILTGLAWMQRPRPKITDVHCKSNPSLAWLPINKKWFVSTLMCFLSESHSASFIQSLV